MSGQIKIRARYRTFIGKWFDYLLVSEKEMKDIVNGTGWSIDQFLHSDKTPMNIGLIRKRASRKLASGSII